MKEDRKDAKRRATVRYTGRVQGVGFRFTARRVASRFDIAGYVKNEANGAVSLVAEGFESEVRGFLNAIRSSGVGGYVADEEIAWGPSLDEFGSFDVQF
ncbi:MAG: acylphosphatase [Verrucomicrobia bacterium]|nr:acylphosphatase [Verrucomicrobiota bacterium]